MSATSLAQAVRFILHGSAEDVNTTVRILDYGHPATFAELWQDGLKAETRLTSAALVLCGANPPRAAFDFLNRPGMPPVDVSQHFSAYSWAAAFRLINPQASVRIVVIESTLHLQVHGAGADLRSISGVTGLCFPSLTEILEAIKLPPPPAPSTGEKGMLRGVIQQHLLPQAEDHHKMGNIVGALMLSPEQQTGPQILGALFQALEPDTKFEGQVELPPMDEKLRMRVEKGPPFVLFDDMGSLWKPFVRRWIPEARLHIPPVTANSRKSLAERIKALVAEPVQRRSLNASDFGATDIADGEPFVLLLDLRLFAGDQRDDEVEFVSQLEEVAQSVASAKHLKWSAIGKAEISEGMKAWHEKQTFSPAFRKTRSWLPRLISLIDPTLPMVIFSSTQDPEVLREFRGYGNIITDFSKPMFRGVMGEAREWAGAATLAFEKALRTASRISSAQARIRKINAPWIARDRPIALVSKPSQVEIFIDESGTASEDRFAIGAVVLISGAAVFDHVRYRNGSLSGSNCVGLWGIDDIIKFTTIDKFPPLGLRLEKGELVKVGAGHDKANYNASLNAVLEKVESLVTGQDAVLLVCSLLSVEPPDTHNIASPKHPVHRYRDVLGRLLEAVLFHCDPVREAIDAGARIAVDAATAANRANNWNQSAMHESFGTSFFSTDEGLFCVTFSHDDLLPLITGLLVRNNRENLLPNVARARAAKLFDWQKCIKERKGDGKEKEWQKLPPKPLHYLADWIAHFTWDERAWREVPNIPVLNKLFTMGFRQIDGDELRTQLQCHRRWSQAARIAAIRGWANIKPDAPEGFALTPRIAEKAAKWMEQITDDELVTLFHAEKPA